MEAIHHFVVGKKLLKQEIVLSDLIFYVNLFCRKCKEQSGCQYFTIDESSRVCYLKHSKENVRDSDSLISGSII